MLNKIFLIIKNVLPIFLMVLLIPIFQNDYWLTIIYIIIIAVSLTIKHEPNDLLFLIFGFIIMTLSEFLFLNTGVETFNRISFLNIMPLWLPFLWGYAFVIIKRCIKIIN